jgi:ATP-binding cassette subfamily C protein
VRDRGGIVVVIAHRPAAIAHVDKVLAMTAGKMQAIGPKEEVLRKVLVAVQPGLPQAAPAPSNQPISIGRKLDQVGNGLSE